MQLPKGATVAVVDGEKFNLFRNSGDEAGLVLSASPHDEIDAGHAAGAGRHSSSANPDQSQADEDGFSAGVAEVLNTRVLEGKISSLLIIAAPRALGALRKHYHPKLAAVLSGEIAKDLAGLSAQELEKAILAA